MIPVNQVIVGGDPLLGSSALGSNIEEQLKLLDQYKKNLELAKASKAQVQYQKLIWDDIDSEMNSMTEEQKGKLFLDEDYVDIYTKLQGKVNTEILNLVKGRIENTLDGKELLERQLKLVRKLKSKIVEESNKEMEMFRKFREYSKSNPGVTYDEFIKASM